MAKNLVNGSSTTIEENGDNISIQINFPIGYIYLSTDSTNPSTYFGGTWQRISNGKVLVGVDEGDTDFSAPNLTGGEKTHTLTVNEMPSHNHRFKYGYGTGSSAANAFSSANKSTTSDATTIYDNGGGEAHNNLQPYFTCYIWEKVGA